MRRAGAADAEGMQDPARVIRLELRLDGESPIGHASTRDHGERAFAGWLGLIAAIDALTTGDHTTTAGQNARTSGQERTPTS